MEKCKTQLDAACKKCIFIKTQRVKSKRKEKGISY